LFSSTPSATASGVDGQYQSGKGNHGKLLHDDAFYVTSTRRSGVSRHRRAVGKGNGTNRPPPSTIQSLTMICARDCDVQGIVADFRAGKGTWELVPEHFLQQQ